MKTAPLSLFELNDLDSEKKAVNNDQIEDKLVTPLAQVFEHITPNPENETSVKLSQSSDFKKSLDSLFPEQQYDEKNIQKAKEILGKIAENMNAEQLKDAVIEIQFLAESWLDDFERSIFKGLTLQELLHEKGGI